MKKSWIITGWLILMLIVAYIISPINSSLPAKNSQEAIDEYIQFTQSIRVKAQREIDSRISIVFDRTDTVENIPYEVFQLGTLVKEEDDSNPRYITLAWLYWDAKKLKLYEKDMTTEILRDAMPWRKNK